MKTRPRTRVSTDAQKQEGTIHSRIAELKLQIAEAGDELVKEYVDDGYSGARMDRPVLEELRREHYYKSRQVNVIDLKNMRENFLNELILARVLLRKNYYDFSRG